MEEIKCKVCGRVAKDPHYNYFFEVHLRNPKGQNYKNGWSEEVVRLCENCQGTMHGRYKRA